MTKINQYEFSIEIDEYIFNRFVKDKVREPYNNYEDYKAVFESRGDKVPITKAQWTEVSGQEIEGLGFRARHKAGLKGIFGRDRPVEAPTAPTVELTPAEIAKQKQAKIISEKPVATKEGEQELIEELNLKNIGKGKRTPSTPYKPSAESLARANKARIKEFQDALKSGKLSETETALFLSLIHI